MDYVLQMGFRKKALIEMTSYTVRRSPQDEVSMTLLTLCGFVKDNR